MHKNIKVDYKPPYKNKKQIKINTRVKMTGFEKVLHKG